MKNPHKNTTQLGKRKIKPQSQKQPTGRDRVIKQVNKWKINWAENINRNIPKLLFHIKAKNKNIAEMLKGALASTYRHGINLREGVLNPAVEDCVLEAVINNINQRDCFEIKIKKITNEIKLNH